MSKNLAYRCVRDTSIVYHGADAPSREEWETYLRDKGPQKGIQRKRSLIISDGGALTSAQRKQLKQMMPERLPEHPMALLTDNALIRGSVTAMNWIGFRFSFAAFRRRDFDRACDYLGLTGAEREECREVVRQLEKEVRGSIRATA